MMIACNEYFHTIVKSIVCGEYYYNAWLFILSNVDLYQSCLNVERHFIFSVMFFAVKTTANAHRRHLEQILYRPCQLTQPANIEFTFQPQRNPGSSLRPSHTLKLRYLVSQLHASIFYHTH